MFNKAIICGNLGSDPDCASLPSGDLVANFSVATTERWKDRQTGDQRERTDWHRCKVFGRQAEVAKEYLRSGMKVLVEGKINYDEWEDRETGKKRQKMVIKVDSFKMLNSRPDEVASPSPSQAPAPADNMSDDIPFN